MELNCAACDTTLSVSAEQIGGSVRCPACKAVMQVQPQGTITKEMVTCPGCASKLVVPDSTNADVFRCPKCSQRLSKPQSESPWRGGEVEPVEVMPVGASGTDMWAGSGAVVNEPSYGGYADPTGGFGPPQPSHRPSTRSSTAWGTRDKTYPDHIASVAPGALLLILASIGVLVNLGQFFFAVGINDPERLVEEEVRVLKWVMMGTSCMGGIYMLGIAYGALQMILRQRMWAGKVASIMAILPAVGFAFGTFFCIGWLAYPVFLGIGIWGSVVLFGARR